MTQPEIPPTRTTRWRHVLVYVMVAAALMLAVAVVADRLTTNQTEPPTTTATPTTEPELWHIQGYDSLSDCAADQARKKGFNPNNRAAVEFWCKW